MLHGAVAEGEAGLWVSNGGDTVGDSAGDGGGVGAGSGGGSKAGNDGGVGVGGGGGGDGRGSGPPPLPPLPPLLLRGASGLLLHWHAGLNSTCSLLADVGAELWNYTEAFMPLDVEEIEQELNEMFDACFELCAYDTHAALMEMSGALWDGCQRTLRRHCSSMPPRPDVFAQKAEGVHRRFANMIHTLLVRHDLDQLYLGSDAQQRMPVEPLEPSLMLRIIGWAHAYGQKMGQLGGSLPGQPRVLLSEEATQSLISSYLHACRSVSQQLIKNIIFCEQQTMLQRNEKVGDEGGLSQGILMLDAVGGHIEPGFPDTGDVGSSGGRRNPDCGIGTSGDGGRGGGGDSSFGSGKLYFTEMHIDVFRIVHEQVELALATTLEDLVFNVMLSAADFLVDVQNELLNRLRAQWRSLGFLYLCASINNASHCAELWADVLTTSLRQHRCDGCGLGEALGKQMHLGYVSDGFRNLANAATQLACFRIITQLEPSLNELFRGRQGHTPREMGALISHFLGLLQGGVMLPYAHRACGLCIELLLTVYGAMLFVQVAPFDRDVPQDMRDDLAVFAQLLAAHSTDAGAPGHTRLRAERLHALLLGLAQLLHALLDAPRKVATDTPDGPLGSVRSHVAHLRALDTTLSRELLARLICKCAPSSFARGKWRSKLIETCDKTLASANNTHGTPVWPHADAPATDTTDDTPATSTRRPGEAVFFFARMAECLRMGRKFSVQRVLELRDGDVHRT